MVMKYLQTVKRYFLFALFIAKRIFQMVRKNIRNGLFYLKNKIIYLSQRPGYFLRKKGRKLFCENNKNIVDRVDYISLKEQAEQREKELENSLALVRATLDSTADAILLSHIEGGLIDWNQKFVEMSGMPPELIAKKDDKRGIKYVLKMMKDPLSLIELIRKLDAHPEIKGHMDEVELRDGRFFERYTQPHVVNGKIIGRVWSFRDVTERKRAEEALRLRDRAMQASTHGIVITDSENYNIIYVNPAFEKITGYKFSEVQGKNCRFLQNDDHDQVNLEEIRLALKEKKEGRAELRNYRKDGTMFWNELHVAPVPNMQGKVTHYVGIVVDITDRKAMEEQLLYQATHDNLTKLPNRILLNDRITQGIIRAKRSQQLLGIIFLDLDFFKLVNDTLGHTAGDHLLNKIAERLTDCIRESDTLARMGGDEFIFIISYLKNHEDIIAIAEKILETIRIPIEIDGTELNLTGSLGISFYPNDGEDAITLVKHADLAMYRAKDLGRNNFQFYTNELSQRISKRVEMEHALRKAIENNEFILYFQPITDVASNKLIGAEVLLRWNHPNGMIYPDQFIGIAEASGLIVPIGNWVLEAACRQCKEWWEKDKLPLYVSINVSSRQFGQENIVQHITDTIDNIKLDPKQVTLELTETLLMENADKAVNFLKEIKKIGVNLSIDDFGTGYSSFSYLYAFGIDQLKIDKSFIDGIPDNQDAIGIALAIIALAKQLKLKIVAEGVETQEQLDFLRANGCDAVQGYFFAKPMPLQDFIAYARKNI